MRALEGEPTIDPRTVGGGQTTYGGDHGRRKHQAADAKADFAVSTIRPGDCATTRALNWTRSPFNQLK